MCLDTPVELLPIVYLLVLSTYNMYIWDKYYIFSEKLFDMSSVFFKKGKSAILRIYLGDYCVDFNINVL